MSVDASQTRPMPEFFGLLSPRRGDGKILCANDAGQAIVLDADARSVAFMPHLCPINFMPISFAMDAPGDGGGGGGAEEQDLYLLNYVDDDNGDANRFLVLRHGSYGEFDPSRDWHWRLLPPAPFVVPSDADDAENRPSGRVRAHAVAGGRTICIPAECGPDAATFCFDTVRREWRKASDWALPFVGGAEHLPELGLWLGFTAADDFSDTRLCATPALVAEWEYLVTPEGWRSIANHLINLGGGRFCAAETCLISGGLRTLVVLTGGELDAGGGGGKPSIVPHRSVSYTGEDYIKWVMGAVNIGKPIGLHHHTIVVFSYLLCISIFSSLSDSSYHVSYPAVCCVLYFLVWCRTQVPVKSMHEKLEQYFGFGTFLTRENL
ncbi:hypothetical protein ACP4OV_011991 [Aristida adscensionis]